MKEIRVELLKDYRYEFSVAVYMHGGIWQGTCTVNTYYDAILKYARRCNYGALTNILKRLGFVRSKEIVYPNNYPVGMLEVKR